MSDDGQDDEPEIRGFGLPLPVPPGLLQQLHQQAQTQSEQLRFQSEGDQYRVRRFVESLDHDQLHTLLWLIEGLSLEGKHNYSTMIIRGVLLAEVWHRNPVESELLGGADGG